MDNWGRFCVDVCQSIRISTFCSKVSGLVWYCSDGAGQEFWLACSVPWQTACQPASAKETREHRIWSCLTPRLPWIWRPQGFQDLLDLMENPGTMHGSISFSQAFLKIELFFNLNGTKNWSIEILHEIELPFSPHLYSRPMFQENIRPDSTLV